MPDFLTPKSIVDTENNNVDVDFMHTVRITTSADKGAVITANLPETVSITVASDWAAPFADKAEGGLSNLIGLLGASLKTKALTAQRWTGSSPIEVTIPFVLVAKNHPKIDVIEPIKQLTKLCLPDAVNGERFIPPGPNFIDYVQDKKESVDKIKALSNNADWPKVVNSGGGETIDIKIGGFISFDNVVMLSVSPVFYTQRLHHSGLPLKADVEITFRMYTTSIKKQVESMYNSAEFTLSVLEQTGGDAKSIFGSIKSKISSLASNLF